MFGQKMFVGFLSVVLMAFIAACAGTPTASPTSAPQATAAPVVQLEKVTLAYGAPVPTVGLLPIDVAMAMDLFKQEGLDMMMTRMPRLDANSRLLQGQFDFAGEGFNPSDTQMSGKAAQAVTSLARLPGFTLVVRSDMKDTIKSPTDLKGQKINYGGAPGVFPYVVAKAGLKSDDAQFVEDGRNIAQIAADMQKGVGVAAVLSEPYTSLLLKSGKAYALVDLATEADSAKWLGGEYQSAALMTTTDTIKNHPQTTQKMTNALVKALRYIVAHGAADIAALLPEDVTGKDKAAYVDALQHSLPSFSKDGIVSEAGVKNAIEINKAMGAIKPDAQISASSLYTNDFVMNVR